MHAIYNNIYIHTTNSHHPCVQKQVHLFVAISEQLYIYTRIILYTHALT